MINLETIPDDEQKDILSSFWSMLRECEAVAYDRSDTILKHEVEGWYRQWNRITGQEHNPIWKRK